MIVDLYPKGICREEGFVQLENGGPAGGYSLWARTDQISASTRQGRAPCADHNLHSQNGDPDSRCQLVCLQIKIGLFVLFRSRILDNFWKSLKAWWFSHDCKCEKAFTMRAIGIVLCMTRITCMCLPKPAWLRLCCLLIAVSHSWRAGVIYNPECLYLLAGEAQHSFRWHVCSCENDLKYLRPGRRRNGRRPSSC